jgi:hypothetical protein
MEEARVKQDRHAYLAARNTHDVHLDFLSDGKGIGFLQDDVSCRVDESKLLLEQLPAISLQLWKSPMQLDLDADEWLKNTCMPHLQFAIGMTPEHQRKSIDKLAAMLRDCRVHFGSPCFRSSHVGMAQFEVAVLESEVVVGAGGKSFTGVCLGENGRLHAVRWLSCPRLATSVPPGGKLTVKSAEERFGGRVVLSNDASFEQTIEGLDKYVRTLCSAKQLWSARELITLQTAFTLRRVGSRRAYSVFPRPTHTLVHLHGPGTVLSSWRLITSASNASL